jgi:uncharacterized protein (TIGR03437 family)
MRHSKITFALVVSAAVFAFPSFSAEPDALAIDANIQANHLVVGGIMDPVYDSATGTTVVGYSRCGDTALWTGAYLAAESFRYNVTQSPDALNNVKNALAAIKGLVDVTGNNRLARCMFAADWPFASYVEQAEMSNGMNQAAPWVWIGNTSRDEVVGVFFGLGVAYDLVNDAGVKSTIGPLASRIAHFIADHQWSPGDDITTTFLVRPEELQTLLDVTRHVNPGDSISGPFINPIPFDAGVLADIMSNGSYFKFNLDYMSFYHLVMYQNDAQDLGAYVDVRNYTANHQNPFFDVIDHALRGPNSFDPDIRFLTDEWLLRPRRDLYIDDTKVVKTCSATEACEPIPVPIRPTTDFLWQRDPFQLTGGGFDTTEGAGIDYILPYWMGRYYGVIPAVALQSAAAIQYNLTPDSLASLYALNLAGTTQPATSQPLPTMLAGSTVLVTDAGGNQIPAPLIYASPTQINLVVPHGTAAGTATFTINNGTTTLTATANIQAVAPAVFSANSSGIGVAAATAIAQTGSSSTPVTVFQCGDSGCSSVPIALAAGTTVYVSFYGTGIRNAASVTVSINGANMPVQFVGAAPGYTGLDQINVALDPSLAGSGEVPVILTADGQNANTVTINVQ